DLGGGRWSLQRGCRYADLAGEGDLRPPKRQSLRNLFVGRPQQGALGEQLWICVVCLGKGVGKCLSLRRDRRQGCDNPGKQSDIRHSAGPAASSAQDQGLSKTRKRASVRSPAVGEWRHQI